MQLITYLFIIFFSISCWAERVFILDWEGEESYSARTSHSKRGHWSLLKIDIKEFKISELSDDSLKPYGKVGKLNERKRTYRYELEEKTESTSSSFFPLGSVLDALKYYEVYDGQQNLIGHVEGKYIPAGMTEFIFFDQHNNQMGKAILNGACTELFITDQDEQVVFFCEKYQKTNNSFSDTPELDYFWRIHQSENPSNFDHRFFWPFMAFVCEVWWQVGTYVQPKKFIEDFTAYYLTVKI